MYFTAPTYTKEDLASEYKRLAKKLHPDVKGGSEAKFKEMKAEYDGVMKGMRNDKWVRPVEFKLSKIKIKPFSPGIFPKREVTPEEVKEFAAAISKIFEFFNKHKKRKP